jgi:hypothetical protein
MDVARLLKPPYQLKWKSAPIAEWIGDKSVSNLFKKLFALHANGVMSSQKTKAAITKQQSTGGRLNFTKKHDSDFVDNIDFLIRVACSMYREVKQDSTKYARCVRKASMEEKENIDSVLSCLSLGCHADEACAEDEEMLLKGLHLQSLHLQTLILCLKKFCRKPPVHLSHLKQKALSLSQGLVAAMKLVAAGLL